METNKFFIKEEYITCDEILPSRERDRIVTILGNPRVNSEYGYLIVDVQFMDTKLVRPLRVSRRVWRVLKQWGSDTQDWLGKSVILDGEEYQQGRFTIGVRPYEVLQE